MLAGAVRQIVPTAQCRAGRRLELDVSTHVESPTRPQGTKVRGAHPPVRLAVKASLP
jgi:hypothetical protein